MYYDEVTMGDPLESKKNVAIKNILNIIDLAFDPEERDSRRRQKVRQIVLDEINDLHREYLRWVSELIKNTGK